MIAIPEHSVLILVDVQNSDPAKHPRGIPEKRLAYLKNVERVTEYFRQRGGVPIVHIREIHRKDLVDFGRELDARRTFTAWKARPKRRITSRPRRSRVNIR